jgi:hypothetical protein
MPEIYIDHKIDESPISKASGIVLNLFNATYCKKVQKKGVMLEKKVIMEFIATQTYLNIRMVNFTDLRNEFQHYSLVVYDCDGRPYKLD